MNTTYTEKAEEPGAAGIQAHYLQFRSQLTTTERAGDPSFLTVWELHTECTTVAGMQLLDAQYGPAFSAAEEVRLHLARFPSIAALTDGMPVTVPVKAARAYEQLRPGITSGSPDTLWAYLRLAAPIIRCLSATAARQLGRTGHLVQAPLELIARSAELMTEQLDRLVPDFHTGIDFDSAPH